MFALPPFTVERSTFSVGCSEFACRPQRLGFDLQHSMFDFPPFAVQRSMLDVECWMFFFPNHR
jgi:hypothetical protein